MKKLFKSLIKSLPITPHRKHTLAVSLKRNWQWFRGRSDSNASVTLRITEFVDEQRGLKFGDRYWFFFGIIDWHFRFQRPQQLAKHVALTGERVYYISPHFIDDVEPGYQIESLSSEEEMYQVKLHVAGAPAIYFESASPDETSQALAGLGLLLADKGIVAAVAVVEHAYWANHALSLPNSTVIYDCMDHHDGFGHVADSLKSLEYQLLNHADLVIVTSDWLYDFAKPHNMQVVKIRNACDFNHFSTKPASIYRDPEGRKVIGYFGAIAEWVDVALVARLAEEFSDCAVVLIGADSVRASRVLARYPNVVMLGEQPYKSLPYYLHGFDVCLLPFQVLPLTLATNPVKVYEYLCAGKHVVCVDLPEIEQFGKLVFKAEDSEGFVRRVHSALCNPPAQQLIESRQAFARHQNWHERAQALIYFKNSVPWPLISVIVLTYNNLDLTKLCVRSLFEKTDYPRVEWVFVDNNSTDGTPEYLKNLSAQHENIRLVLNASNMGFAAGNNMGLQVAKGDFLVILNNDTVVTPGWLRSLYRHFKKNPDLGLLGPVTNNIGNEAKIDISFPCIDDVPIVSRNYTLAHMGQLFKMRTVAFFCVMMPRRVFERVGGMDENYGRGFFEDDDYCRRVEEAGFIIGCADDVFVYHHLSASFGQILNAERQKLFEDNKAYYESKWGKWIEHRYRNGPRRSLSQ